MMNKDASELPITGADVTAAAGYDAYVREFLSYGSKLRALFTVAEENPQAPLLSAHAAVLHLAFEGAEGWANAAPYLDAMRKGADASLTERERLFCASVEAWAQKDFFKSLDILEELTVRWPADLCALKWGQYHAFNLGDQAALLRFGERARIVHEDKPYVHGMIAFALEQNHRLDEAEEQGVYATEIAIDDAWAHHAVAHVMETQGRAGDGARWLDRCAHTWENKGVFIRDHNWWHAGLFRLALGRENDALGIFDNKLWGAWPEFPQEQIGAVSMLWRLEMRDVDTHERWTPVVEQARARAGEHLLPFHDLHYLYALARAGAPGEGEAFVTSLRQHADRLDGRAGRVWRETVTPAAEASLALAREDYETAADCFRRAMPTLHLIGGSHAQRHLFVEAYEYAAARTSGQSTARQ